MPNAGSFPDGRRGRVRVGEVSRVAEYAASTLPVGGPGMLRRTLPSGTTCFPLPSRRVKVNTTPKPWQPVRSRYTGTGEAPDDQKRRVKITMARVRGEVAENWTDEFLCFTGSTTPASPTYTTFYAELNCLTTYNDGNVATFTLTSWQIKTVSGLVVTPVTATPGQVPTVFRVPFATVGVVSAAITSILPGLFADAQVNAIQTGGTCEQAVFDIQFTTGGQ